jgi:peptidase E
MINPKPVYLLAGGRGSENKAVFKAVFNEIAKHNPLIAYVGVANDENRIFFRFMGNEVKKAGKCNVSHAIIASKKADLDKARDLMHKADAIFMSGGDVDAGMKVLESKDMLNVFTELYNGGKVFFGASAGSIMLCREWVRWADPDDDSTAEIFPCLDIAPVICDTHAEEDDWMELKTALRLKGDKATGYGIPSGACLRVHPDGQTEALEGAITRYVKSGHEVIRSDDLFPG